jgi:RNA polymerase sigma-70 factor (ECF subfamily)
MSGRSEVRLRDPERRSESLLADTAALLKRCGQGDDLAWESLVRRYQSRVYGVAFHYVRNREEARDLTQEIFIRIYERLDSFQSDERFLPWMFTLARNLCLDRLRQRKARPPASDVPFENGLQLPAPEPGPEDTSDAEARKRLLYRAMNGMSEKNRELLLMKDIQELKLEEISSLLDLPVGTVKSRSNRARLELASRIRALDPSYGT